MPGTLAPLPELHGALGDRREGGFGDGGDMSPCPHRVSVCAWGGAGCEQGAVSSLGPRCTHPGQQFSGWVVWDLAGSL